MRSLFRKSSLLSYLTYKQAFKRLLSLDRAELNGILDLFAALQVNGAHKGAKRGLFEHVSSTGCPNCGVEYLLTLNVESNERHEQFFVDALVVSNLRRDCIRELRADWKETGDLGVVETDALPALVGKAIKEKDSRTLKALSDGLTDVIFDDGDTPLHRAVEADDVQMVSQLLSFGCATDPQHHPVSPLLMACKNGFWMVAMLLVEAGADFTKREPKGFDALFHAATTETPDLDLIKHMAQQSIGNPQRLAHVRGVAEVADTHQQARSVLLAVINDAS